MKRRPRKDGTTVIEKDNALLIDGNALLKFGFHGAKNEYNHFGIHIGGLYTFLNILRKLMDMKTYDMVCVFWDGPLSGKLRYEVYEDYKANRDKDFKTGTISKDEDLIRQKKQIWNYLEQLSIRQLEDYVIEGDDLIAHFCKTYQSKYNITIATTDRDMAQLINENIEIYFLDLKTVVNLNNYNEFFKHHHTNALLVKMMCGDNSDNVKGIKGLKETTLLKYFPEIAEREVSLKEIISHAISIQKDRKESKKKSIKALDNIINKVTDGIQGDRIYEVNKYIMDLKNPLLTKDIKERFEDITTLPLDQEGRNISNIYTKMKKDGLDRMINEHKFVEYMLPFKRLINKEKVLYENWLKEC